MSIYSFTSEVVREWLVRNAHAISNRQRIHLDFAAIVSESITTPPFLPEYSATHKTTVSCTSHSTMASAQGWLYCKVRTIDRLLVYANAAIPRVQDKPPQIARPKGGRPPIQQSRRQGSRAVYRRSLSLRMHYES